MEKIANYADGQDYSDARSEKLAQSLCSGGGSIPS